MRVPFCHCCGAEADGIKTVAGADLCPTCLPILREKAVCLHGNEMALPRVLDSLYKSAA